MTKREAVGILRNTKWIADINQSKRIATAIETIEKPMDEYRQAVKSVEQQNRLLSSHILYVVQMAKSHGIEIEYDLDNLCLRVPSEWL